MNFRIFYLTLLVLLTASAHFAIALDQTISIENRTDFSLNLNLTLPERTAAVITMAKLKSQQELQDLLHKAILINSAEDIRKAVTAGANVNLGKDNKASVLFALLLKKENAVEALLKCGANTDIIYSGHSLLQQAIKLEDIKSALLIVKKIKNTPHDIDQCMEYAFTYFHYFSQAWASRCNT